MLFHNIQSDFFFVYYICCKWATHIEHFARIIRKIIGRIKNEHIISCNCLGKGLEFKLDQKLFAK